MKGLTFSSNGRLPVIQQSEASECGLACIAMVASFYGYQTNLATLRARFNTSLHGMTFQTIRKVARQLGLMSRSLQVDLEDIGSLQLPAIIHWDFNHFVVLKSASTKYAVIHDPKSGQRRIHWGEFSRHYTGVALELSPTTNFEKRKNVKSVKITDLWTNVTGLKRGLIQLLILTLFIQVSAILSPLFLQIVVDDVIGQYNKSLLFILTIGFAGLVLLDVLAMLLRQYVNIFIGNTLNFHIASNLFRHLLSLPLDFFEKRKMGDINSRFNSIEPIRDMIAEKLVLGLLDSLLVLTTFVMMLVLSPILASISLISFVGFLVLRMTLFAALKRKTEDAIACKAQESSEFMESVRSIASIRIFGAENDRHQKWQNTYAESINANIGVQRYEAWYSASQVLLSSFEMIVIVYLAAGMVMSGDFSVGLIFAFQAYRMNFVSKSHALVRLIVDFLMLRLHLDRIADIIHTEPEISHEVSSVEATISNDHVKGNIELRDLSYSYSFDAPKIIDNLSLKIKAGDSVVIIGASGCGKTTLLKLMAGLLVPQDGDVLIDNNVISVANVASYRGYIGVVMQEDSLLSGTIAENIAFFDPQIDMDRVVEAAKKACIFEDIASLAMNFQTLVGEMGAALSGGQKQRIAIARALYRKPKILLMDEGTSNLDIGTENQVNLSISKLAITRIIVAHRPETIRSADHVFLLKDGNLRQVHHSVDFNGQIIELAKAEKQSSKSWDKVLKSQETEIGI